MANMSPGRLGRRSSRTAGRSVGRAAGSRCEEPFDTVAESADVCADLVCRSAAGDISGVDAVDADREEIVPLDLVQDVGLAQFAEAAEDVACFELVVDLAVSGAWEVVEFGDGFLVWTVGSARCRCSDASEDPVVEAVHRLVDSGDDVNGVDDEVVEGLAEACSVVGVSELPEAGPEGRQQQDGGVLVAVLASGGESSDDVVMVVVATMCEVLEQFGRRPAVQVRVMCPADGQALSSAAGREPAGGKDEASVSLVRGGHWWSSCAWVRGHTVNAGCCWIRDCPRDLWDSGRATGAVAWTVASVVA